MKIGFIINSLGGGGAERVVQTISNHLSHAGDEIHIFLLDDKNVTYEFNSNIKIHRLTTSFLCLGIFKIIFIPLLSIELLIRVNRLNIKNLVSFLVRANLVFCLTKIFYGNNKVIISERNYSKSQYLGKGIKNRIMNSLIGSLYPKADLIIPISKGIEKSLIKDYNISPDKLLTIYNPQNLNPVCKKIENFNLNSKQGGFKFITVGRLIPQKNHKLLIDAFEKVNNKNINCELVILGEGPLRDELTSIIEKKSLSEKVNMVGFVDNPHDYLNSADCFVFSSSFEGFGNVLVEAMVSGLPVISTDCPSGPSEILGNGEYGKLIEMDNAEVMAKEMLSMMEPSINESYRKKSLIRASHFDVKKIANQYLEQFK